MKHLTPAQIAELEGELLDQLAKLERSMAVSDQATAPVELDQTAVGRLSRMSTLESQGMARNLQERERLKLGLIQGALSRLAAGTFGVCVDCGAEIPFGRLYVMPETPSCAACG